MMKLPMVRKILLITLAVLGIVMVARWRATSYANLIGCQQYLTRIEQGLQAYAKEHDGRYPASLEELVPEKIPHVPTCAASQKPYLYEKSDTRFKVSCVGGHKGLAPGEPYVDSQALPEP